MSAAVSPEGVADIGGTTTCGIAAFEGGRAVSILELGRGMVGTPLLGTAGKIGCGFTGPPRGSPRGDGVPAGIMGAPIIRVRSGGSEGDGFGCVEADWVGGGAPPIAGSAGCPAAGRGAPRALADCDWWTSESYEAIDPAGGAPASGS